MSADMSKATAPEPEMVDRRMVDLGLSGIGVHPVGGFGVPHDGCKCGTCQDARARAAWPSERAELLAALRDVLDNGLIYWEPQTSRGAVNKALMIKRARAALAKAEERR